MPRKFKGFSAVLLSLTLCLSGVIMAAVATEPDEPDEPAAAGAIIGTYDSPAKGGIVKLLRVPAGTNFGPFTFTFHVKKVSVDGVSIDQPDVTMPDIGVDSIVKIHMSSSKSDSGSGYDGVIEGGNILNYYKDSGDLFGELKDRDWPHAGVYVYEIAEADTGLPENGAHSYSTYSQAKYRVNVYVKENSSAGSGTFYVFAIGAFVSEAGEGQEGGVKVDPAPGGSAGGYKPNGMVFESTYVKTNGPIDLGGLEGPKPSDDATLTISKVVAGDFARGELYFPFSLTLTAPPLPFHDGEDKPVYRAYVIDKNKFVEPDDLAKNGANYGAKYITVAPGSDSVTEFSLKHGQKLVFFNTPVGMGYTVTEEATRDYKAKCTITYTDQNETASVSIGADYGVALSTVDRLVGEGKDSAADYTNTHDSVTPTGLHLNDLPFIAMIALAILGITGYIMIKSRKMKRCN